MRKTAMLVGRRNEWMGAVVWNPCDLVRLGSHIVGVHHEALQVRLIVEKAVALPG
jgi:hypothetical protein